MRSLGRTLRALRCHALSGRLRPLALAVALGASAMALGGCPGAHSPYPSRSCTDDVDCYQGEKCMNSSVCVPAATLDMAASMPLEDMAESPPGGDS